MTKDEVIAFWQANFGAAPGEDLRDEEDLSARIHYLPGGERYPRHRGQYARALERMNAVLDDVLGRDEACVVITSQFGLDDPAEFVENTGFQPLYEATEDGETPAPSCTLYFKTMQWRAGVLDDLLRAVIDEDASSVAVMSPTRRWIAFPYDGGVDVRATRPEDVRTFRRRFHFWRPFAGEIDPLEVVRAAHPDDREALEALVLAGASAYLDDDDRVRTLHVCSSKVDDAIVASITTLSALVHLHVIPYSPEAAASRLTDRGVSRLEGLTRLRLLNLPAEEREHFPAITEAGRRVLASIRARIAGEPE